MELHYTDGNALVAHSEEDIQFILNAFAGAYKQFGLDINIKKTQILYQPPPNRNTSVPPQRFLLTALDWKMWTTSHILATYYPPKRTLMMKFTTISGVLVGHSQD